MKYLLIFKNWWLRLLAAFDRDRLKIEPQPVKDWLYAVTATFLVIVFLFAVYYYFDQRLAQLENEVIVGRVVTPPVFLNKQQLEQIIAEFQKR